jgi:hypothetical protein
MRKKILIAIGCLTISIFCGIIIMIFNSKKINVPEFNLTDYNWEIEHFSSNKNVGQIDNANIAIEKAKELWLEIYGMINGEPYDPTRGRKINVSFDSENDCWRIYGTLPSNVDGAVPQALIKSDGDVLAVWMG